MEIKFAEINGLYSYGREKNRIDFGQKTVIVGTNNSGKSAIFKALNYLLKCLTKDNRDIRPWDLQNTHEMTVGLVLNDTETRYVAELLTISYKDNSPVRLAPDDVVKWLAPKLKQIEITIILADDPHLSDYDQIKYAAYLKDLDVTVCSQGWHSHEAWICKSAGFSPRNGSNMAWFDDIIEHFLKNDAERSKAEMERESLPDWPEISMISLFPEHTNLMNSHYHNRERMEFLLAMLKHKTSDESRSFFTMLGIVLKQRFAFVSEQRKFQESNDFEMCPLKDDGSNLQSFLYWLQNGDRDEQDAFFAIQKMFNDVVKQQNLSFIVSITKKGDSPQRTRQGPPKGKIYPGEAIVQFVEKRGQYERITNFMDIGAGIREMLFLLAKCFGRQDKVILLDEPAVNLHPTQIRQLMIHIISTDVRSGQVAVVTHSPALASLEMLSSANEIVRVDRREYSRIMQPSGEARDWMKKNLPAFHMLKSDVLFAKKVILVEGNSDKIFLEYILNRGSRYGDDVVVLAVGGVCSFKKFRKFLEIFDVSYGIIADKEGKELFDSMDILKISLTSIPQEDWIGKKVCLLEKDLELLLTGLEPKLYKKLRKKYKKKPERAYEFLRQFFADENTGDTDKTALLEFIRKWCLNY